MSIQRGFDGDEPVGGLGGTREERLVTRRRELAVGSMACPACDAPVLPDRPLAPTDPIVCPFCAHDGRVRDFLTLGEPTRPARVVVRVIAPR